MGARRLPNIGRSTRGHRECQADEDRLNEIEAVCQSEDKASADEHEVHGRRDVCIHRCGRKQQPAQCRELWPQERDQRDYTRHELHEAIRETLIRSPDGALVPLDEIASVEEVVGPRQITRERGQRFIAIQCNVVGRDIGGFVTEAEGAITGRVELPPGYLTSWGGSYKLQQEANRRFAIVIPITLILIFMMIYAALNSMRHSLLILFNIPLALVGGVVALWLSGEFLSVPATVGFIALFGIALGNGLVLVTYTQQLVEEGMAPGRAATEAACRRLRPVLMTAVTTGLGLLPLLLANGTGSEVQRPLAVVVIGGLISSTALTLLVLPALYPWFATRSQSAS